MAPDRIEAMLSKSEGYFKRIRKAEQSGDSEIQTLFRGSVVFITGGTGFVGKQLVEKLLRSCCGIQKVYLLMREKKGMTVTERLEEQWKDPVYSELRKIDPDFCRRVFPIHGDVAELKLGIKDEDWDRIKNEITFIFHTAATVRFDEPLHRAILVNVRGTKELLSLANDLPKLKALVYVSSAYANCNRAEVREVFYDTPVKPETILEMAKTMDKDTFEAMTGTLTEGWPNTYTFSKALSENLVRTTAQYLPVCVVRPSIIVPTFQEPVPGWLDIGNVFGPSGIILGIGLGVIHMVFSKSTVNIDLVPLDLVNNMTIAAAWDTVRRHERNKRDVKIYTCSRNRNIVKWDDLNHFMKTKARDLATARAVWYCFGLNTRFSSLFLLSSVFLHFIPALIIDAVLTAAGDKPRLTKVYCTVYKMNQVLSYFVLRDWQFHDDSSLELMSKMSKKDRDIYQFDLANIDLDEYMTTWCIGLRKYIVKDGLRDTEWGMKKQIWLGFANFVFFALYGLLLWYIFSGLFRVFKVVSVVLTT